MVVSVNTIPSMNVPLVDKLGRISPIWHEFLRSFVASSVDGTISSEETVTTITAGAGLTGGGAGNSTLAVGAGAGIAVNADDVSVDIAGQTSVQAALDDYVMITDTSDNSAIRKTTLRNVAAIAGNPGGVNTNVQYNNGGVFGGDASFTTNGSGSVNIGNINLVTNTLSTTNTNGDFNMTPNGTGLVRLLGTNPVATGAIGTATTRCLSFSGNSVILYGLNSGSRIVMNASLGGWDIDAASGQKLAVNTTDGVQIIDLPFRRSVTASITASTTQTQGQGALTNDINEISTCANANDTVTLPAAFTGKEVLVINNGAQTLQVFPASLDNLGAGVDTSTTIAAGSRKLFVAYDNTNWEPVI